MILLLALGLTTAPGTLGPHDCAKVMAAQVGYRFAGKPVHWSDGDTLDVARGPGCIRIRLTDIDAPERGEPGADHASRTLRQITAGKVLSCVVERGRNRRAVSFDRVLARCSVGDVGIGRAMRARGVREGGR